MGRVKPGAFLTTGRALVALGTLAVLSLPATAAEETDRVDLDSARGWDAQGRINGTCTAAGVRFVPETALIIRGSTTQAQLRVRESWVNMTTAAGPIAVRYDATQSQNERTINLDGGAVEVSLPPTARAVLGVGSLVEPPKLAMAAWTASVSGFEPVSGSVPTGITCPVPFQDRLAWIDHDIPGPARALRTDALQINLTGHVDFALDAATLSVGENPTVQLPPYVRIVSAYGTPEARVLTVVFTYAILTLSDAHLSVSTASSSLFCSDARVEVSGTATLHDASGRLIRNDQTVAFERRELTLQGSLLLHEHLELDPSTTNPMTGTSLNGWSRGSIEGSFAAAGLDFVVVPSSPSRGLEVAAAVGLTALLLGWASWGSGFLSRGMGFFFSRMTEDRVLLNPTRHRIHEIIATQPGVILRDLVTGIGRPYGIVRHHVRVLELVGLVRTLRRRRAVHLYPAAESLPTARRALLVAKDAPVRFLLARVQGSSVPRRVASRQLREHLGLSRMGAWKAIRRAEQSGLIRSEGVDLRCA